MLGPGMPCRLGELREVLQVTDVAASLAEGQGAKPALALRSAVQQLCKASLDAMHSKALGKLTSEWAMPPAWHRGSCRCRCRCGEAERELGDVKGGLHVLALADTSLPFG
jgi:hypothetical protein